MKTNVPRREQWRAVDWTGPDGLIPEPHDMVPPDRIPNTIEGWKAASDSLLSNSCCTFHRNAGISARYAWMFTLQPTCFKWAAMAAIASHHVRLALFPLRLHATSRGDTAIPRTLGLRRALLTTDVETIRSTNNAIYDDIFWTHLAYVTVDDGIEHLRALLSPEPHYAPMLAGFEAIDQGRRALEDPSVTGEARRAANDLIWVGNLQLLDHEQRAVVQPNFNRLSCTFATIISLGAATTFEVRSLRQEAAFFTSFYGYSLTRCFPQVLRTRGFPRITRFDDRWRWLEMSVVPHFRRFDADTRLVDASLRRIFAVSREYASMPCEHGAPRRLSRPDWNTTGPAAVLSSTPPRKVET